jgi:four helix bundle protein
MPGKVEKFEDLLVWQKAHQLVLEIYTITKRFPAEEKFGLVAQMRRAAVSVAANIVEGFRKRGKKDKVNFYNIAQGSLEELRYYVLLSGDLNYLPDISGLNASIGEVGRMLHSFTVSAVGMPCPPI